MGKKAWDTELKQVVLAKDAIYKSKGCYICNFCKNKSLTVPVYLREKQGTKSFVSFDSSLHDKDCVFPTSEKYINKFEPDFTAEDFLQKLLHMQQYSDNKKYKHLNENQTNRQHSQKPTLFWLYNVCEYNEHDYEFAVNCSVKDICLKHDTLKYWNTAQLINKIMLIVGYTRSILPNSLSIDIEINGKYTIRITFYNKADYNSYLTEIEKYSADYKGVKICAFGKLELKNYTFFPSDSAKEVTYSKLTMNIFRQQIRVLKS